MVARLQGNMLGTDRHRARPARPSTTPAERTEPDRARKQAQQCTDDDRDVQRSRHPEGEEQERQDEHEQAEEQGCHASEPPTTPECIDIDDNTVLRHPPYPLPG